MTTREIGKIVEQSYGHYYSPQTISVITKQLDEKVKEYHSRKITKDYAVVYTDSTYISVKRGTVGKEALHILIGITISGEKEILSYELFPTESPENYKDMLEDFKKRGLNKVLLFVTDRLKGIKKKEQFPNERSLNRYVCVSACEYNVKYAGISHYGFSMVKEELENMIEEIYI